MFLKHQLQLLIHFLKDNICKPLLSIGLLSQLFQRNLKKYKINFKYKKYNLEFEYLLRKLIPTNKPLIKLFN
jgi:hypothetical protein